MPLSRTGSLARWRKFDPDASAVEGCQPDILGTSGRRFAAWPAAPCLACVVSSVSIAQRQYPARLAQEARSAANYKVLRFGEQPLQAALSCLAGCSMMQPAHSRTRVRLASNTSALCTTPPGGAAMVSQHAVLWLFVAWLHAAKFAANLHSNIYRKPFATRVFGVNRRGSGLTFAPTIEEDVLNYDIQIDARGLHCPEPLMLVKNKIRELTGGDVLHILATDPTTERDFEHFCQFMKHDYLGVDRDGWQGDGDVLQFWIRKQA